MGSNSRCRPKRSNDQQRTINIVYDRLLLKFSLKDFDLCWQITKGARVPVSSTCLQHAQGAAACRLSPPPRPRPPGLLVPNWCLTFSAPAPCPADRANSKIRQPAYKYILWFINIKGIKVEFMYQNCSMMVIINLDPVPVPGPLSATLHCHRNELSAYNSNHQSWATTPQQRPTAEQKKLDLVSEIHIFMLRSHKG